MPKWVTEDLLIGTDSTYAALSPEIWKYAKKISPRIQNFLAILMRSRYNEIRKIRCFQKPWPAGLKHSNVSWSIRTRNCLNRGGLLEHEQKIVNVTFGDLLDIDHMGALSILDFCCTLEAAMDHYEQSVNNLINSSHEKSVNLITFLEDALSYKWTEQISRKDPRFKMFLPLSMNTLKERIENILSEPDVLLNVMESNKYYDAISEIKKYISTYKNKPLEKSLIDFLKLVSREDGDRLQALADRFGCSGCVPASLEECGNRIGVTRERFRQIQNQFLRKLPNHPIFLPELDNALDILEKYVPMTPNQAAEILHKEGVSEINFNPYGLFEAAKLFKREVGFSIVSARKQEMIIKNTENDMVRNIPAIARNLAGQSGITNVFIVSDVANERGDGEGSFSDVLVRNLLSGINNFHFLDDDWFCATDIKEYRNRLDNITRKILSVVSPQNLLCIRDGIRRNYRWRSSSHSRYKTLLVPSLSVLRKYYESHSIFKIQNDLVYSSEILDYRTFLSESDIILFEVLRSSPSGLLDRRTLFDACIARGLNANTFSVYTSYSPIIEHVDIDIWKLRGTKVDPTAIEAIRTANQLRPREKRILQYGWNSAGKLWIAARVPHLAPSLVIGCPSPILKFLQGKKFRCISKEGNHDCGSIAINDKGASYGYSPFVRRFGLDENDILLAEFDLSDETVTMSIADDQILEEDYT